ncbi:gluconeogenesis factor YvcK family protein [Demequina muriae]|uniref:Putative gluconeogenesis factor n=1 Tax=Demequina muriae TaxID=3051664 RepID=A0ABT8GK77_9MICO|nr:uridine diphosphate-N-acetylglucosamine-binding protein YvcK [Demequina sp. EGI L300058]MDN4481838.1 uridine diphosphate-N-acetylglucosamine-binding protein YvcK [Demequina sp. EGI L300058]
MTGEARIVALGGGHGLYASLTALRDLTPELTAIVTVADDGGSSGRLRSELGIVPPGDLRMALSALCADNDWGRTWRDVLQWRFATDGPLNGHALGNLLIAALWERNGDVVDGLAWVASLLQAHGRVLPLSADPLEVSALVRDDSGVREVQGQVAVATAHGSIEELRLSPASPVVPRETVEAIDAADLVVLGPGSWYTSVLTHFMVRPVADALVRAGQRSVLVLNVGHDDEETAGTGRADDVRALQRMAPDFVPRTVLVDSEHRDEPGLADAVGRWGARLLVAPVRDGLGAPAHDPHALRRELARVAIEQGLAVRGAERGVAG